VAAGSTPDAASARFLFVTWDGGGNQLPARRIAAELDTRGHQTRWLMLPRKAIDMAEGGEKTSIAENIVGKNQNASSGR
jgi:hypothetical protein